MNLPTLNILFLGALCSLGCRTVDDFTSNAVTKSEFAVADISSRSDLICHGRVSAVETTNLTTSSGQALVFHRVKTHGKDLVISSELLHADLLRTGFTYAKDFSLPVCTKSERVGAQQLNSVVSIYFGEWPFLLKRSAAGEVTGLVNSSTSVKHLEISRTGKILFQLNSEAIGIGDEDDPIKLRSQLEWLMMSYLYSQPTATTSDSCGDGSCTLQVLRMRSARQKHFGFRGVPLSESQSAELSAALDQCRRFYRNFIEKICPQDSSLCTESARVIMERMQNGKAG